MNAPEAARLIRAVYETENGGAGCCLHVQVDDENLANRFFTDEARELIEHPECLAAFDALRSLSMTGRKKACALASAMAFRAGRSGKKP